MLSVAVDLKDRSFNCRHSVTCCSYGRVSTGLPGPELHAERANAASAASACLERVATLCQYSICNPPLCGNGVHRWLSQGAIQPIHGRLHPITRAHRGEGGSREVMRACAGLV